MNFSFSRIPSIIFVAIIIFVTTQNSVQADTSRLSTKPIVLQSAPARINNDSDNNITIMGAGFDNDPIITLSTCNSSSPSLLKNITRISSTKITGTVPSGLAEGIYILTVTNSDGQASDLTEFTIMRRGDESFGPWQSAGNMLMTRSRSSAVIADQYLYVIGGNGIDSSQFLGSIERSRIKSDGTLDTWELAGALSSPRAGHASILVGQYLYVLGGETTLFGMQSNLVERAAIKPDGSLSTWETMPAMIAPRADFAAIVVNNYLYVIGGYNTGNQNFTQVEAAKINTDVTLDSWTLASSTLSPKYSAVSDGNVIYAIGNDNTIERSESKDDGTLSFWNVVSLMPGNRSSTSAILVDGYLYAIGAFYPCIYSSNQVIRAKINPDKSLGSWIPTASMQFGRSRFALAGTSTHMYVMGGWSGWHGATNSVEFTSHRDLKYRLYMTLFAR